MNHADSVRIVGSAFEKRIRRGALAAALNTRKGSGVLEYGDWLENCWTRGRVEFQSGPSEVGEKAETLPAPVLAEYLVRMFGRAGDLRGRYSRDQLAEGTWFLFGIASGYFGTIREPEVPARLQAEVYAGMFRLYAEVYDHLCNGDGTSPDDCSDTDPLDIAVYMIWDMDCVEGAIMFPEQTPHLVEPGFATLEAVLRRCRTPSCLKSAMHGLGHLQPYHQERVAALIADLLDQRARSLPQWLNDYALAAMKGMVQ